MRRVAGAALRPRRAFVRQRTAVRTLVDDWADMGARRVLGTMFERMVVGPEGDLELVPRQG